MHGFRKFAKLAKAAVLLLVLKGVADGLVRPQANVACVAVIMLSKGSYVSQQMLATCEILHRTCLRLGDFGVEAGITAFRDLNSSEPASSPNSPREVIMVLHGCARQDSMHWRQHGNSQSPPVMLLYVPNF